MGCEGPCGCRPGTDTNYWTDNQGAVIVEVDHHELEADEAECDGGRLAIIVLDMGHMYGLSFVPRPPGALLH